MRIVFMGTPEIAKGCLTRLVEDGRQIAAVYTKPDTPQKRGLKLTASAVKEYAAEQGLSVLQPTDFKSDETVRQLRDLQPDLIAVVAYGRILPQRVLDIPPLGCINIHASLLPQLRGAAPIQRAVLQGLSKTGVTAMHMSAEMDAGDIIDTAETPIGPNETSGELTQRLALLGSDLLSRTIDAIAAGTAQRRPQDPALVTFAPMLSRQEAQIDWTRPAGEIHNQIRGMNPWPIAQTTLQGTVLKLHASELRDEGTGSPAGTILSAGKQGLDMACGGGTVLRILRVQAQGGRQMTAAEYFRGHPLVL